MSSELFEKGGEKLENYIITTMAQAKAPGLSIAIIKDSQVVYARGFGARNLEDNLPSTPHTLYGIGSCTKSFTALAIMQLVEQGKLDIQDPVSKYVPFKLGKKENPIRIHHLLSMSSGIPNLGAADMVFLRMTEWVRVWGDKWIPMSSMDDFFSHINGALEEVAAEPGKRFFYLNEGYTLLGEIIERVSKMKYEDYIKEKILKPLKMNRSTFLKEDFEKDHDAMTAYWQNIKDGTLIPTKYPFHKLVYAPGALISSVMELSNYLIANMNNGIFKDTKILDASLLEEMHKTHIEINLPRLSGKWGYGYGWGITDFLGHKLVTHGGGGVVSAYLAFMPDQKIGVALACNLSQNPIADAISLVALALLIGKDPMKELPFFEIEKRLSMLTGVYETYKGINRVQVVKKGPLLYLNYWDYLPETPLIPESEKIENFKFYIMMGPGVKMPVEFVVDPSGKIDLYMERNRLHKVKG